ncbi:ATP-binding protein [Kitasatospora sp. NPDC018619]|uniref:wHTH domain-containing protein n=1 Tax=unclassified Kitasatospora TaxID=2633591 RepID=UPI0037BD5BED
MERYDIHNQGGGGTVNGMMAQAGVMNVYQTGTPGAPPPLGPWAQEVWNSRAWTAVEPYRQEAAAVAGRLRLLHDQAHRALAADPWRDPGYGLRFLRQAESYLPPDLCPAEAALLLLVPLIHQVYQEKTAVGHLGAGPTDLGHDPSATGDRLSYQRSLAEHGILLSRARLRPEAREPIGWWLYHRWLLVERGDTGLPEFLDLVVPPGSLLREVLDQARLRKLLYGFRRGPDVCSGEHLDDLKPEQALRAGPGRQLIRERRLALLLALAHGTAIEMTALPDTVVEHLGIPVPVQPAQLRETLEGADWKGSEALPVLDAVCHHGAVKKALGEHIARVDELLHGIQRVIPDRIAHAMPQLPQRFSTAEVRAADENIVDWVRFRLDERRVRDLLMGTQLYKDRNLAVRELYQNALDACRYRRARTEYLRRTGRPVPHYEGGITFTQGEEDGRPYLECYDDGVGMGETQLRGVFSQAGARFADQPAYRQEAALWAAAEPPIELFPNSRFGIGVLSYFMLADEIEVTTCRMDKRTGLAGAVLEASIFGPGHLFGITRVAEHGTESYTRVRLYLRQDAEWDPAWSCVDVLCDVLGIAEFTTTARHGSREEVWERGVFAYDRLDREGRAAVPWPQAPDGVDIIWCEGQGTLMVDGLVVSPPSEPDLLSSTQKQPFGLAVNLRARYSPARLSVDRGQVLDGLPAAVSELIAEAARALLADPAPFVSYEWLMSMSEESPRLADLVAEASAAAGTPIRHRGASVDLATVGGFEPDIELRRLFLSERQDGLGTRSVGMPDHLFLWRILVHGPNEVLSDLARLVPELRDVSGLLRALPSDRYLVADGNRYWGWLTMSHTAADPGVVYHHARRTGRDPFDVARRARALGVLGLEPEGFATAVTGSFRHETALLDAAPGRDPAAVGRLVTADLVPVRHALGTTLADAADRLRRYGFDVPAGPHPEHLLTDGTALRLLSRNQTVRRGNWLTGGRAVRPGHVLQAALVLGLEGPEVVRRLEGLGRPVEPMDFPTTPDHLLLRLSSKDLKGRWPWLSSAETVPPGHLLAAESELGLSAESAAELLLSAGFRVLPLPDRRLPRDREILEAFRPDAMGRGSESTMTFEQVFEACRNADASPAEVVARLEAYGVGTGLRLPAQPRDLEERLLAHSNIYGSWWSGIPVGRVLPFHRLVGVAGDLGVGPGEVAACLTTFGITVSRHDLPQGLDLRTAVALVGESGRYIDLRGYGQPSLLPRLVEMARRARLPVAEAAHWLRELGADVPDVADMVRAALARVPREIPAGRP